MNCNNKNIFQIYSSNYEEGCGFFVENKFYTSGHVIEHAEKPFIEIDGKKVYLSNPYYFRYDKEVTGYDIAIFEIPLYSGSLEWYEGEIMPGMKLLSQSYKCFGMEYVETEIETTKDLEGNYFYGESKINLKGGSSGSPAILGNKVVGILTAGNNNGLNEPCNPKLPVNFCAFLSSTAILKLL
jgi:hypothetical protein